MNYKIILKDKQIILDATEETLNQGKVYKHTMSFNLNNDDSNIETEIIKITGNIEKMYEASWMKDMTGNIVYENDILRLYTGSNNKSGKMLPDVKLVLYTGGQLPFYDLIDGCSYLINVSSSEIERLCDFSELEENILKHLKNKSK